MERSGNRRPRVERLVSAWNQGTRGDTETDGEADDPLIGASKEPKRRARTRLTDEEVNAMRTARAQGISVTALARQFDLTCTLLVTCAVEHVGYVVGGHGLGLELSAGQSDGDVLQGA